MKVRKAHILHLLALFGLLPPAGLVSILVMTPLLKHISMAIYITLWVAYAIAGFLVIPLIYYIRHPPMVFSSESDISTILERWFNGPDVRRTPISATYQELEFNITSLGKERDEHGTND
jgi:hypothetical protein